MLDTFLKIMALAGFIVWLAVIPRWVPVPDLIAVVVLVAGMAVFDFFIWPRWKRNGNGR